MDRSQIEALLNDVSAGSTSVAAALERLRNLPFEDLGFAKLDHHRALRTGMPEVIFAESKTPGAGGGDFCAYGKGGRKRAGHARFSRGLRDGDRRGTARGVQRNGAGHHS